MRWTVKLPDFLHYEPFNQLRAKMQTEELGHFEFFDPRIHLTGGERSTLARTGLKLIDSPLLLLSDHTLGYKNSRVAVTFADHVHVSGCKTLVHHGQDYRNIRVVTSDDASEQCAVCSECLHLLRYQGFDAYKERKAVYSQQVLEEFTLEQFFAFYTLYPVKCHEMTNRQLPESFVAE